MEGMGEIKAVHTDQCDGWLLREWLSCCRFALLPGKARMWIYSLLRAVTKYKGEIHPRHPRRWPVGSGKGLHWQKGAWGWWKQWWAGSDPWGSRAEALLVQPHQLTLLTNWGGRVLHGSICRIETAPDMGISLLLLNWCLLKHFLLAMK